MFGGVVLALLSGALGPEPTEAPRPVSLQTEGPAGCADPEVVLDRLDVLLTNSTEIEGQVQATVTIDAAAAPTVEAELELVAASGSSERRLRAASCEELVEAVALVLAVTVDPLFDPTTALADPDPDPAPDSEPEPEPEPEPDPEPEPEPEPNPDPQPAPTTTRGRPIVAIRTFAAIGLAGGLLPDLGLALEAGAGLRWGWLRFAAVGRVGPQQTHDFGEGTVGLSAWSVGLHGCFAPVLGRFELGGCVVAQSGQVRGVGLDLAAEQSDARPFVGVGSRLEAAIRLSRRVSAFVAGQAVGHVVRPSFHVLRADGSRLTVHESPEVGGRAVVGLVVRLP